MLTSYIKTAFRHLVRHWGYSLLNVAGLSIGIACCLLIFQYVSFERSFDTFNVNSRDLYRVTLTSSHGGEDPHRSGLSGHAAGPALAEAIPEIIRYARVHPDYTMPVISNPEKPETVFEEPEVYYTDPAFLEMFTYPFVAGDADRALVEPGTMVISESAAKKYFGQDNPLGKVLVVTGWISGEFRITGVFADVPQTSHLRFDFLLPMNDLLKRSRYSDPETGWSWNNFMTYVQLEGNADVAEVERKFTDVLLSNRGASFRERNIVASFGAQPVLAIHLNDDVESPNTAIGSHRIVYFFTVIGLVTFFIALINYVNLATARALDRAREVGVRKVIGAQRAQLMVQFFFEAGLTNLVAVVVAAFLAVTTVPLVNAFAGTTLPDAPWTTAPFWIAIAAAFLFGTLFAGAYPALVLSSFRPISVLKGRAGWFAARLWLRRGLVVIQFAASVVLLIGVAVVFTQLTFMRTLDLGINLEQILTVAGPRVISAGTTRPEAFRTFARELHQVPGIRGIATSTALPGRGFSGYTSSVRRSDADPSAAISGYICWIDTSFARLYDLELIAGEGFVGMSGVTPNGEPVPVISNETAAKALGFDMASDALDRIVTFGEIDLRIVGVFRDFYWSSAHEKIENALFALTPSGNQFSIKIGTEDLAHTLADIERLFTSHFPDNPFLYAFADVQFDEQYRNDQQFATLFSVFAGLAILIACLGLFGLSAFTARQRTKEIGVRKVLGASVPNIVVLLSRDFLMLVGIAFLLAAPIAYISMQRWLEEFAYRISIGPNIFILTSVLLAGIALLTISYQSIRAALSDPVKSLRYE